MADANVKCACADCACTVEAAAAVEKDGRMYCCDACAEHHKDGSTCQSAGCSCHG